jgi:hypothetical protein
LVEVIWPVRILESVSVILGALLAYFAYRGYRRSRSATYIAAASGFLLLSVGNLAGGILFELAAAPLLYSQMIRAAISTGGLLLLLYSVLKS